MNNVARWDVTRRAELFGETASRRGLSEAVIEKDFWVCWTLRQIFSIETFKERLLFKGGTSLSKVFGAINRFSEDIDLAVDYTLLGFAGERDPRKEGLSRTKQDKLLSEMLEQCAAYIRTEFLDTLRGRFVQILGKDGWALGIDEDDPHAVRFRYPKSVKSEVSYVSQQVVLELGTHAEFIPRENFLIRSSPRRSFRSCLRKPTP